MARKGRRISGFAVVRFLVALLFGSMGILLAVSAFVPQRNGSRPRPKYMPVLGSEREDLGRLELDWSNRLTYPTGVFDPEWVRQAATTDAAMARGVPAGAQQVSRSGQRSSIDALSNSGFTALGPAPLRMTGCFGCFDYGTTAGRVNSIAIDPTTTTNGSIVAYIGTVDGGVWKTTNCCSSATSWSALTDDSLISTTSIDSVVIDPNNHNTIYAGTGDLNFGSFSMGSQGILKSTDGGASWTVLGASVFGAALPEPAGQFPQYQAVGKVRVDPNNSNNVVAGTKTGLYFSYDAGQNWTGPCLTNGFNTQRQDITGLELTNISGTTRIIAAVGTRGFATPVQYNLDQNGANGIYQATMPASGCPANFTSIATNANGWTNLNAGTGSAYVNATTGNQLGRVDIAVAPSNSNYIYAQVQAITKMNTPGCGSANGCQLGAYRSTDGGATWTLIAGSLGASLRKCNDNTNGSGDNSQNWYDQGITVDPNNPDRAFFDTYEIWFWQDPNTIWNNLTCAYGANRGVHADQHALAFVPGSSNLLLAGGDGGVNGTINAGATTQTVDPLWFNMDGGLNTIEFYSGDISGNFYSSASPQAVGGAQDNGASSISFSGSPSGPVQWQTGVGGDGFSGQIDPVGNGSSLRFWQGNNDGTLNRCTSNCTASGAPWSNQTGPWYKTEQQSFILPINLFHGGISGGDDCPPAGATGGCGHLLAGTTRVWETTTGNTSSVSWYVTNNPTTQDLTKESLGGRSFINQVKYSPKFQSVAIAGTNDGNVQIGFNLGTGAQAQANWVNITGSNTVLPNRPILGIALDPSVSAAATPIGYAAVGGFNANTPATPGHLFQVVCTSDCASFTWHDKTGNLPDIPIDSVIVNPNFPQQVFAGTDFGVYYTDDITVASPTWYRFQNGLPSVMIWDMSIDRGATTLSVWTRGRGAFVWPLPAPPNINLKIVSVTEPTTNTLHLDCRGVPGVINRIESSPDLSPGSFQTLASVLASSSGVFTYDDTNATPPKKFYRLAYP